MSVKRATRDAYGEVLAELGREFPQIVVMDADLSKSTKTAEFARRFPERFFNAGIAEQNMTAVAAGLAATGKIPFISTFAVFAAGRAFEQIRNSVAYPRLNVKIAAAHAGITVGEDGGSHQAIEDIALMRVLPNMTVLAPADAAETADAVRAAVQYDGPVYIRLGRAPVETVCRSGVFKIGCAQVMREGTDAVIFACGIMVGEALNCAKELSSSGIDVAVVNVSTIKPLDKDLIVRMAKATGAALTVEEHSVIGGLGSAAAEVLAESGFGGPFRRVGLPDCFGQSGSPARLLEYYGLTAASLAAQVREMLKKN